MGIIALNSPLLAWDDSDDFGKNSLKNKSSQSTYGFKSHQSEDASFATRQRDSLKVDSFQETKEKQDRWHEDFSAKMRQMNEEQKERSNKAWEEQEARNNARDAQQWKDVETVAGAYVAKGPYYKGGQACVITDKGLVYSTGNGAVVAPDGFYYRSGNLWAGPHGKLATESGSGGNRYIYGSDRENAISAGRGYFTERGYSWPAYQEQSATGVSHTMRKP
ncbi:MAG: hypothetical protein EBV83_05980 [Verrucomicrobia bacterium]|nr:hypothetical protein [Verrucomicrobiota bacterium]